MSEWGHFVIVFLLLDSMIAAEGLPEWISVSLIVFLVLYFLFDDKLTISLSSKITILDDISKHQDFEEVSTSEQRKFTNSIPELSCSSISDTLSQNLRDLNTKYEKPSLEPENIMHDINLSPGMKRELNIVSSEETNLELVTFLS